MKKICKRCGRNRKIGKFGKKSSYSDGKNIYCRDCMRDITNAYKNSHKGRLIQLKCEKTYKKKNKKPISEYNKAYYLKNKDRILYNLRCRKDTECILITEKPEKIDKPKINKSSELYSIKIDPKRIDHGSKCL